MTLKDIKPGQSARIEVVGGEGALRQHFLDMGVIPGTPVTVTKLAPLGDPMELRIHSYELTLRLADAAKITVSALSEGKAVPSPRKRERLKEHPGLGEEGKYHPKGTGDPLPDGTVLSFALV
ncbi:MAG: ferrous iron transport protein A, partial [Oscillospiraceae bacterium]|nr:ferrous iron transport protein A [Oscillospiraceae bacterium]